MLPRHLRIAEAGLALTAVGSVLAFGGVQIHVYSMMQLVVLLLTAFVLWSGGLRPLPRGARIVVAVLAVVPLLQLAPLPRAVASLLSPMRVALHDQLLSPFGLQSAFVPLSISTYLTIGAFLMWSCYLAVFVLAYRIQQERQSSLGWFMPVLIALAVFEAVLGLIQYLADWDYIFWYRKKFYLDDATGTYIDHNHYAFLLALALPFLLSLILQRFPSREPDGRNRRAAAWLRGPTLTYLTLFILIFLGLVFSRSRMGIMSAIAGLFAVVVFTGLRNRQRSAMAAGILVLAIAVAYASWAGLSSVMERFELIGHAQFTKAEARFDMWRETAQLIRDYPLTGTGLGTFAIAMPRYQIATIQWVIDHPHNDYLEWASEFGIPATLLLVGSLWYLFVHTGWRAASAPARRDTMFATGCAGAMVACLIHALTEFNFQIPANAFWFAWLAGTAAALGTLQTESRRLGSLTRPESSDQPTT